MHADHGVSLGENGAWLKRNNFDHATRVPLVITCILTATVVTNFAFAVWRAAAAAEDEARRAPTAKIRW